MKDETRSFLDRIADGALDTIATVRMENGSDPIGDLTDPMLRAGGRYIAAGVIGHLLSLAEQAGADEDMQEVVLKIATMWRDEVSA